MEKASKDEQIGFHKGSITTLAKEREELIRIIQVTEQLIKAHMEALKKLGVDLEKEASKQK
jgi:biotin operon repressor